MTAIVITALVILSLLITHQTRKDNLNFARKAFESKYESVEREFLNLSGYQVLLKDILAKSTSENYKDRFSVLNALNQNKNLVQYNWYFLADNPKENKHQDIIKAALPNQKRSEILWEENFAKDSISNFLVHTENKTFWINYDSIHLSKSGEFYFGSTIDLQNLHDYFANVDKNQSNYAFVFTKNGTCIFHPEQKFIGKNIFDFTNIKVKDTLTEKSPSGNTEYEAISEYLGLEVTRFIKPLKTKNFDGYIAVNYANLLIDESVNKTKTYVAYIFLATFFLIMMVFIFYYKSTQTANKYKEKIREEKNKLLIDNEKILRENAVIQLQQLKSQMNPHFLFNSLNSLYMLIGLDKTKAQKFTLNLSKIYRYLITSPNGNLVTAKEELSFIKQYMELQKTRFENEISFKININNSETELKRIPYLSLQIAVENAIKHNIATEENPLDICIFDTKTSIVITNTYQPKEIKPQGESFGLNYLQKIYDFYNNPQFKADVEHDNFIVYIPFLA